MRRWFCFFKNNSPLLPFLPVSAAAQSQYPGSLYSPLHSMWMGAAAKQYSAGFKREDQNGVGSDVGGENGHYGQPVGGAGAGGEGGGGGSGNSHGHHHHHHHQIPDFKPAPESLISGLSAADYMSTTGAPMSSSASQPRKAHEGTSSAAAAAAAASLSSSTAYPYYSPYVAGLAPKSSGGLSTAAARSPKQKARNTAGKKSGALATIDDASN